MIARPYIYIGVLIFLIGLFAVYGNIQYKNGFNAATVQAQKGIDALQTVINESNLKEIQRAEKQKESLNYALILRDNQYKKVNSDLKKKLKEIEDMKNEDNCLNVKFPDDFKRMLHTRN